MTRPLRALIIDDSPDDAGLLARELARCGYALEHRRADSAASVRAALRDGTWDIIFCDWSMPGFGAPEAVALVRGQGLDLPFVIISGTVGEETAVEALKAGADDFILKDRLARLESVVERELREAEVRRQRHRAETAHRESERKYRRIVETAREGIWVIDADNRRTYMNRRMAEMLGTSPEGALGTSLFDFADEQWVSVAQRSIERRRRGIAEQHDFQFRRRDRSEFWASLATNPITDDAGVYVGALAMVTDITEQRRLQAQLMVSDRMVSVGTLAAGVAHEINNPLATVLANVDLAVRDAAELTRQGGDSAPLKELREELADAREAAERVRAIVRDLKIFSRTEEDKRGPVDVHRVLDSSLRMAWNEIRHRASLVKDYRPVPPVDANESRLGQVFLNLVVNAAQAIPEGHADANQIRVSTDVGADGGVVVAIRDSGSGMGPEVQERLFTPFFTTKPVGVGTGLGLSICHRIVTSIGGEIGVESQVGRGTVFTVTLPPMADVAVEAAPPLPAEGAAVRRGRVLVVDDEALVLAAVRRTLAPEHEVTTTTSAQEALSLVTAGAKFDVILCDVMMPFMTGMHLYAELCRVAPDQAERVVFVTGGAFTPRAREFLETSRNLRIEKPFELAALRAVINDRVR